MARIEPKTDAPVPLVGPGIIVPITSFAPEPYDLIRQMMVVIQAGEEEFLRKRC